MTMQYRMVCAHFGDDGHQLHKFDKVNLHSAKQSVIDTNHKAEVDTKPYAIHAKCAPYIVETREVTLWTELTE